eukprot:Nk52_evm5s2554 gene=Nk52_evmTU5s2554
MSTNPKACLAQYDAKGNRDVFAAPSVSRKTRIKNISHRILWREHCTAPLGSQYYTTRKMYKNIYPNSSIFDIEAPQIILKKFSPDGQYFVCFSRNQQCVVVYKYKGFQGILESMYMVDETYKSGKTDYSRTSERTREARASAKDRLKKGAWGKCMTPHFETVLSSGPQLINKDFCLFSPCGQYVIVASSAPSSASVSVSNDVRTPDTLSNIPTCDDIVLYSVCLESGRVCDKYTFYSDFINTSHNLGVYMYDDLLCVLSIRHQAIHILQLKAGGKLAHMRKIGSYCFEDDELFLARHRDACAEYQKHSLREKALKETVNNIARSSSPGRISPSPGAIGRSTPGSRSRSNSPRPQTPLNFSDSFSASGLQRSEGGLVSAIGASPLSDTRYARRTGLASTAEVATIPARSSSSRHVGSNLNLGVGNTSENSSSGNIFDERENQEIISINGPSVFIGGLKHRLLAFMLKKALRSDEPIKAVRHFYFNFNQYSSLCMGKVQFIDEHHLLIKYSSMESVVGRQNESSSVTAFFVVVNIVTTQVIAVHDNTSEHFLKLFEDCCDYFRAPDSKGHISFPSSCSSNKFARDQLRKHQYMVRHARNGGHLHAIKRVLSSLPFSSQTFSPSPYFDQSLYSYDEKVISSSERPKPCNDFPVKFYNRDTDAIKFKINPGTKSRPPGPKVKKYASYIFHPHDPFVITVQHTYLQPSVVNLHLKGESSNFQMK